MNPEEIYKIIMDKFNKSKEKDIHSLVYLIAAKRYQRAMKGLNFDCFVLRYAQFENLIKNLKQKDLKSLSGRVQLIIADSSGSHFLFVDLEIKKARVSFFILEAGKFGSIIQVQKIIAENLEIAKIYACSPGFQKDWESCALFAFSYAEVFSKIKDWHDILANNNFFKVLKPGICEVERKHLPAQAVKQSQSLGSIKHYIDENESSQVTEESGKNLTNHLKKFGRIDSSKYDYLSYKDKKYKTILLDYFSKADFLIFLQQTSNIDCEYGLLDKFCNYRHPNKNLIFDLNRILLGYLRLYDLQIFKNIESLIKDMEIKTQKSINYQKLILSDILYFVGNSKNLGNDVIKYLLKNGVDPNIKNAHNNAPIHMVEKLASSCGNIKYQLLHVLCKYNADLLAIDCTGKTILDYDPVFKLNVLNIINNYKCPSQKYSTTTFFATKKQKNDIAKAPLNFTVVVDENEMQNLKTAGCILGRNF